MTTSPERLSRLEGAYEQVDQRLGDLTGSVESLRGGLNSLRGEMNTRLDGMDRRLDTMDMKFEAKLNVLIGVAGGSGIAIVLALIGIAFAS